MKSIVAPLFIGLTLSQPCFAQSQSDISDNYKLDISVPVAPGLILAGGSELENTAHSFGRDFAFELTASKNNNPNAALTFRPYIIGNSLGVWREQLEEYRDERRRGSAWLKRTQVSGGIAHFQNNGIERLGWGIGAVFYPLNSNDPRLDPLMQNCLSIVTRDLVVSTESGETMMLLDIVERGNDGVNSWIAKSGWSTDEGFPEYNFAFDKLTPPIDPTKLPSVDIFKNHVLMDIDNKHPGVPLEARRKIQAAFSDVVDAHQIKTIKDLRKKSGRTTAQACAKKAANRYLNNSDFHIGFGYAEKSANTNFSDLKSAGVTGWLSYRHPFLAASKEDQNKKKPFGSLNIVGRLIEKDQILVAPDTSENALTIITGASASMERESFKFQAGVSYNYRDFKNSMIPNHDFMRGSAGLDIRLSDDIWWTIEGGDILGNTPFNEGSYLRSGFKFNGQFSELFSR